MFAYDYDDTYGSTSRNPACVVDSAICAKVGNFDVSITGTLSGGPVSADFSPDNTQDGGNVAHTFVGWEGINPSGWSEPIYDNHSGTTPGVMAYIFTGTHGTQTPEPSTWAMMLGGFAGLGSLALARRRRKAAAVAV
jgi:PEP-CTERM motif